MKHYLLDGHKLIYHLESVNGFLSSGDSFPLYIEISPVGSCNHRCLFCAYDFIGYPNRKLDTPRTFKLLDELAECGLKSALFAGEGEPLIHPDIAGFIGHAKEKGIDVGLFTNGQLLKEKLAKAILPSLTFLRLSFNGGTRDAYSAIHQVKPSVFDTVTRNIAAAVKIKNQARLGTDIGAQFVLIPENLDSLLEAIRTLKDIGADYLVIKPFVHQDSRQGYQPKKPMDPKQVETLLQEAESLSTGEFKVIARKASFAEYGKRNYSRCYGTSFITVLNSAGELATCLPYWDKKEFVFGNIQDSTFKEIWTGKQRARILKFLHSKLDAKKCPPNCRPNAVNEFLWDLRHPTVKHINFI